MTRREQLLQRTVAMRRVHPRHASGWTHLRLHDPGMSERSLLLSAGAVQGGDHDQGGTVGDELFERLPRREKIRSRRQRICAMLVRKLGRRFKSWLFQPVDYPLDIRRFL